MKRLLLCVLSFVVGLAGGSAVRFAQHWQHGYRQGYLAAKSQFQREAVREGHAHWEPGASWPEFRWNDFRTDYAPESASRIPGLE